jgi:tetraacyldisaccharide 4'-kinase
VTVTGPNEKPDARGARRWEGRLARRGGAVELLRAPELLFRACVAARRTAYDRGWLASRRVAAPVISVGNLSTGGTGKTPLCAWVVRQLVARGWKPGLLSRGYRAAPDGRNDEARLLERACPGVPHVQDPDRVRGAHALLRGGAEVIVLDDGFQHRRLARDLDLVLVDATRPWGLPASSDREGSEPVCALLPRGFLREPPSSLARADAIVLTRTDHVSARVLDDLERALARRAPGRPIVRTRHRTRCLLDALGAETDPRTLSGREVDLVSAIGNPEAFERSVRATGAVVGEHRVFPDHHPYVRADLEGLGERERMLVTTTKDAVKLARLGCAFATLEIEIEIERGAPVLEALLDALPLARDSVESKPARTACDAASGRRLQRWSGAHA